MYQILKRFIAPLALLLAVSLQHACAEAIRIVGPDGATISASQTVAPETQASVAASYNASTYGPTGNDETLWSIADKLRPSSQYSIQQILLAIYKLNPKAFDNQNIHELIPGSRLRTPSLAQIQAESTQNAIQIMQAHQARLSQSQSPATPVSPQPSSPQTSLPQPTSQPAQVISPIAVTMVDDEEVDTTNDTETQDEPSVASTEDKVQPTESDIREQLNENELEQQITTSERELEALEEKNHQLRLMLSSVQNEVGHLKEELGDESRIRNEVEKLLEEQRRQLAEQEALAPSQLDLLLANKWFVTLLALIPGLLFVLIVVLILTRKTSNEAAEPSLQESPQIAALASDDDVPEINLDEDIDEAVTIEDDLFGEESDQNIFDLNDEEESVEPDVFAGLEDEDLDFNLDDEDDPFADISDSGDFDTDLEQIDQSANGISVNGDEKALSLEEMERALDEEPVDASEEQEREFDLSDESESLDDELSQEGGISQNEMNELLSSDEEALTNAELDQSDLDDLFSNTLAETKDDESEAELDDFDLSSIDGEDDILDENSTDLLDDIVDQFDTSEDISELSEESTDLLDDLIDEQDLSADININENSTELLDELLSDESLDDSDTDVDDLLAEFGLDPEPTQDAVDDTPELDENSTALLDELLDSDSNDDAESAELNTGSANDDLDIQASEQTSESNENDASDVEPKQAFESDVPDNKLTEEKIAEEKEVAQEPSQQDTPATSDADNKGEPEIQPDSDVEFDFTPHIEGSEQAEQTDSLEDIDSYLSEVEGLTHDKAASNETFEIPSEPVNPTSADDDIQSPPELAEEENTTSQDSADEALEEDVAVEEHSGNEAVEDLVDEERSDDAVVEEDVATEQINSGDFTETESTEAESEPESTPTSATQAKANEFGIPQDEDWDIESEQQADEAPLFEAEIPEPEAETDQGDEDGIEISDDELGEYDENAALRDLLEESGAEDDLEESVVPQSVESGDIAEISDEDLGEYNEEDALSDVLNDEALVEDFSTEESKGDNVSDDVDNTDARQDSKSEQIESENHDVHRSPYDEVTTLEALLSEDETLTQPEPIPPLDEEIIDSAGMNFESMLDSGEDWNGFELSPEQKAEIPENIPEDELDVWGSEAEEAVVKEEDWSDQSAISSESVNDKQAYLSVDELMAQADMIGDDEPNPDEEQLNLDVGLNEFPDVLGDVGQYDADTDAEAAGKLDLAKIYIEMNDSDGAVRLLEEAILYGNEETQKQAQTLLDDINKQ